jgi:hypothetical protein
VNKRAPFRVLGDFSTPKLLLLPKHNVIGGSEQRCTDKARPTPGKITVCILMRSFIKNSSEKTRQRGLRMAG